MPYSVYAQHSDGFSALFFHQPGLADGFPLIYAGYSRCELQRIGGRAAFGGPPRLSNHLWKFVLADVRLQSAQQDVLYSASDAQREQRDGQDNSSGGRSGHVRGRGGGQDEAGGRNSRSV